MEQGVIAVEPLHGAEVCVADAHNHNCHRQGRAYDYLLDCFVYVVDPAVCEHHENVELLGLLADFLRCDMLDNVREDLSKVGWRAQTDLFDGIFVSREDTIDAGNMRVGNVPIEREAK